MLVPVSQPDGFEGGGTAYWARDQLDDDGAKPREDAASAPRLTLTPPAGTALVFAGCVMHAARAVQSGERCVLVASFSPAE